MRYVIFDLEATCDEDEKDFPYERMETIEIGAVLLVTPDGDPVDEFATFIRPVATRELTAFCTELTGITQPDVAVAAPFCEVFPRFVSWCEESGGGSGDPFTLYSWGAFDLKLLRRDCERHKMAFPASFERHINVKAEFARRFQTRPIGMMAALKHRGITAEGRHHSGIDDARNITKLARLVLPSEGDT